MVVHPVLDAPKGFNLLHPGELSRKAVASGNPAVVVELHREVPGRRRRGVRRRAPAPGLDPGCAHRGRRGAGGGGSGRRRDDGRFAGDARRPCSQQAQSGVTVTATGHNGMGASGLISMWSTPCEHAVTMTALTAARWVSSGEPPTAPLDSEQRGGAGGSVARRETFRGRTASDQGQLPHRIGRGQSSTHHQDAVVTSHAGEGARSGRRDGDGPDLHRAEPHVIPSSPSPGPRDDAAETSGLGSAVGAPGSGGAAGAEADGDSADRSRSPCHRSRLPCRRCRSRGRRMSLRPLRLGCRRRFRRRLPHVVPQQVSAGDSAGGAAAAGAGSDCAATDSRLWCRRCSSRCRRSEQPQPQAPDLVAPPLQPTLVPPVQQQVPPRTQQPRADGAAPGAADAGAAAAGHPK